MPREHQGRISNRPELTSAPRQPEALQVVARPVNMQPTLDQGDNDLSGLLEGLKAFNPALERYADTAASAKQYEDQRAGSTAGNSIPNPLAVINDPVAVPSTVDPAFAPSFINGYEEAIGKGAGRQIKSQLLGEYEQQKNADGFDVEQFLQSAAQRELAGINNPSLHSYIAPSIQEAAYSIREDFRKHRLQGLQEKAKSSIFSALDEVILPNMNGADIHDQLQTKWLPIARKTGLFTQPELSHLVIAKLGQLSDQAGGRPELFDAAYVKDASGIAIADSPEIATKLQALMDQAKAKRDRNIAERSALENAQTRIKMEQDSKSVTDEQIWQNFHPVHGIFKTDDEVWAFMRRRDAAKMAEAETFSNIDLIRTGQAWRIEKKEAAEAAFNQLTHPLADAIVKAATSGDPEAIQHTSVLMHQMIGIHAQSGRDLANKQIKSLYDGLASEVPKEGEPPSPKFLAAVEMYRAMPSNLRELYTGGDVKQLISNYLYEVENRVSPSTAIGRAYMSISPEAKRLAEDRLKSPDMQAKIAKAVSGESVSFLRNVAAWIVPLDQGFDPWFLDPIKGIYPDNENIVVAAAQMEARRFLERNPNASDNRLKAHLEEFARSRYTYEPVSNKLVEIPPGTDPAKASEAFQVFTEQLKKEHGNDVNVELLYRGNGRYQILSHRDLHSYGEVTMEKLMKVWANSKVFVHEDGEPTRFRELKKKLLDGTASLEDVNQNTDLIAKARSIGIWSGALESKYEFLKQRERWGSRSSLFRNIPPAYNDELTKAPPRGAQLVMGEVAKKFISQGNLTAALITMGEGVVNKVHNDPAKGQNIGMGYNLEANASSLAEDFRRAGIPAESTEAIKAGKVELTQDQSMRLLQVVIPRYEKVAQQGLEKLHPGEWAKLPPNHKAALTDLAYQVGSVDKFPKALQALISGNTTEAGESMAVTFKKRGTGEKVVDTRRNNLRYQMLTNPNGFTGLADHIVKVNTAPAAPEY